MQRTNQWLLFRLEEIWSRYFKDIPQTNKVFISFGREAKYRFGSIKLNLNDSSSKIRVNALFKDSGIPQEIVDHTIAHELVHYTHGFSSPQPRLHQHPHRGGVMDKELKKRGLTKLVDFYKEWVKTYIKSL